MRVINTIFFILLASVGFSQCQKDRSFYSMSVLTDDPLTVTTYYLSPSNSHKEHYLSNPKYFFDSLEVIDLNTMLAKACEEDYIVEDLRLNMYKAKQTWELIEIEKTVTRGKRVKTVEKVYTYDAKTGEFLKSSRELIVRSTVINHF